jgi:hypothetical protein
VKHGKTSKPAQQAPEPLVLSVNTIVCGKFLPAREPIPSELVSEIPQSLIDEFRVDPRREPEPDLEPTLTLLSGISYSINDLGRRCGPRIIRETRQQMLEQQKADILHEQLMTEHAAYEESEYYREKAEDDAASREARIKCLNDMHARRLEAEEFLAREQQEREEQERATVAEISRGPNLPVN